VNARRLPSADQAGKRARTPPLSFRGARRRSPSIAQICRPRVKAIWPREDHTGPIPVVKRRATPPPAETDQTEPLRSNATRRPSNESEGSAPTATRFSPDLSGCTTRIDRPLANTRRPPGGAAAVATPTDNAMRTLASAAAVLRDPNNLLRIVAEIGPSGEVRYGR